MPHRFQPGRASLALAVVFGVFAALLIVLFAIEIQRGPRPSSRPTSVPLTTTSAASSTQAANTANAQKNFSAEPLVTDFLSFIRADDHSYPTTQPLDVPRDLRFAAHVEIDSLVFVCPRRDLWLTHPSAPDILETIKVATSKDVHVTKEVVRFAHWPQQNRSVQRDAGNRKRSAKPSVELIVNSPLRWISTEGTIDLTTVDLAKYDLQNANWSSAISFDDRIVVTTPRGVRILNRNGNTVSIEFIELLAPTQTGTCYFSRSNTGLIAWSENSSDLLNTKGRIATWQEKTGWITLPDDQVPTGLAYLFPYTDGSALSVSRIKESVELTVLPISSAPIDEKLVEDILIRLASDLPDIRQAARIELLNLGPTARPTIERLGQSAPAAARLALRQALGTHARASIGGFETSRGPSRFIKHLDGGGVLLYFSGGVSQLDASGKPQTVSPAWVALLPGGEVALLDPELTTDFTPHLDPEKVTLKYVAGDWFIQSPARGLLRWMGNHMQTILSRDIARKEYTQLFAIDRSGRWVIQNQDGTKTLIVDPNLPDTTPRLPVWTIDFSREAGWSPEGFPAIRSDGAFTLDKSEWKALDAATFQDATDKTAIDAMAERDAAALRYSRGLVDLAKHDGESVELPAIAIGDGFFSGRAAAFDLPENRVLLFNTPGRASLLQWSKDKTALSHIATFTRGIPSSTIRRIWQDPAGRVVIAFDKNKLAVVFVDGVIPPDIQNMMSARALRDAMIE